MVSHLPFFPYQNKYGELLQQTNIITLITSTYQTFATEHGSSDLTEKRFRASDFVNLQK
jgi:hypothetical protein